MDNQNRKFPDVEILAREIFGSMLDDKDVLKPSEVTQGLLMAPFRDLTALITELEPTEEQIQRSAWLITNAKAVLGCLGQIGVGLVRSCEEQGINVDMHIHLPGEQD